MILRQAVAALAGLCLACACAAADGAPPPLAPGERPATGSAEAALWEDWDAIEKQVATSPYRVRDAALEAYVRGVACKVAAGACGDLRIYVLDRPAFNTFMAPNGALLVYTGTLLRLRDEAELAVLLGHELAHFRLRHGLQVRERRDDAHGRGALLPRYTRELEREADREGMASAAAAGYDLEAGARIWTRRQREEAAGTAPRSGSESLHPPTKERIEDARAAAAAAMPSPSARQDGRAAYQAAMRPFLAHWLDEELAERNDSATIRMIEDLRADAAEQSSGLLAYALARAHRQRGTSGDDEAAGALLREAITRPDAPAAAWRDHGFALRRSGQNAAAADALRHYLQAAPQADDRAVVERDLALLEGAAVPDCAGCTNAGPADRIAAFDLRLPTDLPWTRIHDPLARQELWTIDGPLLDSLWIYADVAPYEHVFHLGRRRASRDEGAWFRPGLEPEELRDLVVAALQAQGMTGIATTRLRPARFGDIDGMRFELSMTGPQGLAYRGSVAAAERNGKLDLLLWKAPAEYYYGRDEAAVARMLDGLRFR